MGIIASVVIFMQLGYAIYLFVASHRMLSTENREYWPIHMLFIFAIVAYFGGIAVTNLRLNDVYILPGAELAWRASLALTLTLVCRFAFKRLRDAWNIL